MRDGAQVPAWFGPERAKNPVEPGKIGSLAHKPAVTRINDAVSCGCSEQDDKRFRFHLGRPRAEAHSWGKGARIRTENLRLPQPDSVLPAQNPSNLKGLRSTSQPDQALLPSARSGNAIYLTLKTRIGRRFCGGAAGVARFGGSSARTVQAEPSGFSSHGAQR